MLDSKKDTIRKLDPHFLSHEDDTNQVMVENDFENEIAWLIGNYVVKIWNELYTRNVVMLKEEEFFGFLHFRDNVSVNPL